LTRSETVTVDIEPAPGTKCARSWFVREDVGSDPEHPTLSADQARIVRELIARGAVNAEGA
jgi:isoleucyl-tRNA synthetase